MRSIKHPLQRKPYLLLVAGEQEELWLLICAKEGAEIIYLANRNKDRLHQLAEDIRLMHPNVEVFEASNTDEELQQARISDIIINATTLGMKKDDSSPLPSDVFNTSQYVVDLIYTHPQTPLMNEARKQGSQTMNGLGMLLHQGSEALKIWLNQDPPLEIMRNALEQGIYQE